MTLRTPRHDAVLQAALEEARRQDAFVIARLQEARDRSFLANNGQLDRVSSGQGAGLGVHVFTREGWCGFASTDRLFPGDAQAAVRQAVQVARLSGKADAEREDLVFRLEAEAESELPSTARALADTPLDEQRRALLEAHEQARGLAEGFAVRSGHGLVDEHWRVVRSDGTDVSFGLPHAYVRHDFTARSSDGTASAGCSVSGADASVLLADVNVQLLQRRAEVALARASATLGAPRVRGGSYKVVVDYALAKGLAHEAFGHASETDGAETSILAEHGKLKLGTEVAPRTVSIVDGPIEGDYAYQPISANGVARQTVHIIRNGVLESGLGDLFSAAKAGAPITGACRAQSYGSQPLPRMTNIRILVDDPLPLDGDSDSVGAQELAEVLRAAGLMEQGEQVLYLSGYRGGQVNPKLGDFVFNCAAIFDLGEGGAPRQPAVFSGKSLSALRSIVAGIGPLQLDAMGHCGKGGQSVPSSGGSHSFLVLDRNPEVVIGGD